MRTTLDLPEALVEEAMRLTQTRTKTEVIRIALEALVRREKTRGLKDYFGKIELDIDFDVLRERER